MNAHAQEGLGVYRELHAEEILNKYADKIKLLHTNCKSNAKIDQKVFVQYHQINSSFFSILVQLGIIKRKGKTYTFLIQNPNYLDLANQYRNRSLEIQ